MNESDIRARLMGLVHAPLAAEDYWPSAVLVPLEVGRGVWLTLRSNQLSRHAGQVAFPGGRIEASDASPEAAALREASEEIGLRPEDATILGRMDDYVTGTGFHMIPVLALVTPGSPFVASEDEVAAVFCLPFADLLDPAAVQRRTATFRGHERQFWVWPKAEHLIWGRRRRFSSTWRGGCAVIEARLGIPGINRLWAALPEARIAGGAVRDMLLGQPVADVDFASPLTPEATMRRLGEANIKTVPTGLAHGTITAIIGRHGFEITTLRRDTETDGRHAVIAFTASWREDAARRDFTINAMSMGRDGTIFDYFDGRADLLAGRVRFVGQAKTRITEDYLRILRFFRFFARYAKGEPDPDAIAAITECRDGIPTLSSERIWSELKRILAAPDPGAAVALMQSTGVLPLILPEGVNLPAFTRLLSYGAPADPLMRVAALNAGDVKNFGSRLKLSVNELVKLFVYRMPNKLTPAATDIHLRRALAEDSAEFLISKTWLAQTDAPGWPELRARIAATPQPVFPLQGRDIVALGIPAGPRIGEIFEPDTQMVEIPGLLRRLRYLPAKSSAFFNPKKIGWVERQASPSHLLRPHHLLQ